MNLCESLIVQITVLNAGRKYLGLEDLRGKVLVTSGLGGMSGAQAKAAVIAGCVALIAEVFDASDLRHCDSGLERGQAKCIVLICLPELHFVTYSMT